MLTYTINDECNQIDIVEDIFGDYNSQIATSKLTLDVIPSCCEDLKVSYTIWDTGVVDGNYMNTITTYKFKIANFDSELDKFTDGIYTLVFTWKDNETGSLDKRTFCMFVDCETKCDIFDLVQNEDSDKYRIWQALQYTSQCDECNCEKACILYERYKDTNTTVSNDCGCK